MPPSTSHSSTSARPPPPEGLVLRDGSTANVRPTVSQDREALASFLGRLTLDRDARRLFPPLAEDPHFLDSLCDSSDPRRRLTLVVTRRAADARQIVAAGTYVAREPGTAEIAFAVDDAYRGKGVATRLLEKLATLAAHHDFQRFEAVTHRDNTAMIEMFRRSGLLQDLTRDADTVRVDLNVAPDDAGRAIVEMRDRLFTTTSIRPFFRPRSVAVVGAGRDPKSLGYRILEALITNRFQGPVYVVNPKAPVVGSFRTYARLQDIPESPDLVVVVVPKQAVMDVARDAAAAGARALVVITAGFAETGEEGRQRQQALVEAVRGFGMRMVGPNCMGLLETAPDVRLNATFSPLFPPAGRVAMLTQSGALGVAILKFARDLDLGLSSFVSVGNKADVSGNDLIQYWEEDPGTDVILLYLESFGNPRRFARIARRVGRKKPIVVVKGGRSGAGRRAAGSHTAALAGNEEAADALFRQTGVIRADTLEEMFHLALVLSTQPLPRGPRVAILSNAGGPAILAADALETNGLCVQPLEPETRRALAAFLPQEASTANPVDMIASAGPEQYRQAAEILLAAEEVDALIVIDVPLDEDQWHAIEPRLRDGIARGRERASAPKPVLACVMGAGGAPQPVHLEGDIPAFPFPEEAARVLARVAAHADWRRRPVSVAPELADVDAPRARSVVRSRLRARGPGWLDAAETREVLLAYGLPLLEGTVAASPAEARAAAEVLGYPVVVKLASERIVHKTDVGGVIVGLSDGESVERAFEEIRARLAARGEADAMQGVLVQPMLAGGTELMVGVADDPVFGPLLAFGLGGVHVEVLGDVQFRVTPVAPIDADEMIRGLRGRRLLEGYRGHPAADVEAIRDVLLRTSRLVEDVAEVRELDLNPVFALAPGEGCRIVDARIYVGEPGAPLSGGAGEG